MNATVVVPVLIDIMKNWRNVFENSVRVTFHVASKM